MNAQFLCVKNGLQGHINLLVDFQWRVGTFYWPSVLGLLWWTTEMDCWMNYTVLEWTTILWTTHVDYLLKKREIAKIENGCCCQAIYSSAYTVRKYNINYQCEALGLGRGIYSVVFLDQSWDFNTWLLLQGWKFDLQQCLWQKQVIKGLKFDIH